MDAGPGPRYPDDVSRQERFRKYLPPPGVQREASQLEVELDFNKALEETIAMERPMLLLYATLVGDCQAAGREPGDDDVRIALRYMSDGAIRRLIRKLASAAWKAGALSQQQSAIIHRQAS